MLLFKPPNTPNLFNKPHVFVYIRLCVSALALRCDETPSFHRNPEGLRRWRFLGIRRAGSAGLFCLRFYFFCTLVCFVFERTSQVLYPIGKVYTNILVPISVPTSIRRLYCYDSEGGGRYCPPRTNIPRIFLLLGVCL